jgi:hypothetical protein
MPLILDFRHGSIRRLCTGRGATTSDLTSGRRHYSPNGRVNPLAFIAWHCVRTVDNESIKTLGVRLPKAPPPAADRDTSA